MVKQYILEIETDWLRLVYHFVKKSFLSVWLPSHDHLHHLRVWNNAKDLLTELENKGYNISEKLCNEVFFASFFHDIGMINTIEKQHGKHSRNIFENFLIQNNIELDGGWEETFIAIERHDDKSYKKNQNSNFTADVYTILSIADDLDAYGAIGVYRYFEIYYLRGLRNDHIPRNVLKNIEIRFNNCSRQLSFLKNFIKIHKKRYEFTLDFYQKLFKQMEDIALKCKCCAGESIVIYDFFVDCIEKKQHFFNFIDYINFNENEFAKFYFNTLNKEIILSNI